MELIKGKNKFKTKDMVETALLTALIFVATSFINIKLPIAANGGLVHLGTAMMVIAAVVFGKEKGAIAAAIGMGIFDLSSGWALWAPFTFVIRGIMGYILGGIAYSNNKKGESVIVNTIAVILSGAWMIAGYYLTEVILYGNWIAPIASIPGDITQIIMALIIGIPMSKILKKYVKYI
jgi:uncharacterized membrane protein